VAVIEATVHNLGGRWTVRGSVIRALAEVVAIEAADAAHCALAIRSFVRARTPPAACDALARACFVALRSRGLAFALFTCDALISGLISGQVGISFP
jgi:hypothetical protein